MSMHTCVVGFKPPDETWHKMKAVYDACTKAGVSLPTPVEKYFEGNDPDPAGVEVSLKNSPACKEYRSVMREGYEVDLTKLPKDVKIIRFVNSY